MDLSHSTAPTAEFPPLKLAFGSHVFDAGVPVLAGRAVVELFAGATPAGHRGEFSLFEAAGWRLGAATLETNGDVEAAARRLYSSLFAATGGRALARIWNYVPAINEPGPGGLENYRAFCRARSLAFEHHHGRGFKSALPAASAVGTESTALTVAFAACTATPRHVENPLQVAAYNYPSDYGPHAPSFARATVTPDAVFISGTAAIRGHASIAPGDLAGQLRCTLENLREIAAAAGLGPRVDRPGIIARHFKVYLRHAEDHAEVADVLQRDLLTARDGVSYLRADICREPLLVEIEASVFRR